MSNPIVPFGEEAVKSELRELVGKTIEETVNAMFDEEVDQLAGGRCALRANRRAGGVPRRAL